MAHFGPKRAKFHAFWGHLPPARGPTPGAEWGQVEAPLGLGVTLLVTLKCNFCGAGRSPAKQITLGWGAAPALKDNKNPFQGALGICCSKCPGALAPGLRPKRLGPEALTVTKVICEANNQHPF